MYIFLDACVVDRLSEVGITDLSSSVAGFQLAVTPDLRRELVAKLGSRATQSAKKLARSILELAEEVSFFGFSEENSDDPGPCVGFDEGVWASSQQLDCIDSVSQSDKRRPTGIPLKRTDAYLVALAEHHIVVTDNTGEAHWKRAPDGSGRVIWWEDLINSMQDRSFEDALIFLAGQPR